MRIRMSDGQASEHALSAPGYIVPGELVDGPEIESITRVTASGEELFHYVMPSPETGVPSPPEC
jgi:hypothetical protein